MKIAIAHDYLTQRGGAERVVLAMSRAFPEAPIYTTLYDPEGTFPEFRDRTVIASPLNRIGFLRRNHRTALPFLPLAAVLTRPRAEVVLCSTSGWSHGFSGSFHRLVYCYSPARWLYCTEDYLGGKVTESPRGLALAVLRPALKWWDRRAALRANKYLAISSVIADRTRAAYGIEAPVVPSPNTLRADGSRDLVPELDDWTGTGWYLNVSRLLPYKNVLETIEAFRGSQRRLVIVGQGPLEVTVRAAAAAAPNVRLLQGLTDAQLRTVYAGSVGLIAPSFEDYGLTPLEAGVFGVPTLALRAGGYLDTVLEGVSGYFFEEPTAIAIRESMALLDREPLDSAQIRAHVVQFSESIFARRLHAEVDALADAAAADRRS